MKSRQLILFGFFGILLLSCSPLLAHHGFAGRYDEANPITITGTVVELQLINPHSQLIFEVKGPKGEIQRWHAELGGANAVSREGWGKATVKPGTRITILGPAAKNGTFDMNLSHESRITLADTGKVLHDSIATGNANAAGRGAAAPAAPAAAPAQQTGY